MREGGADRTPGPVHLGSLANTALSDMIRHKRLRADDAIVEARLAETLGVSRTPLREALQRLEGEGMVVKGGRSYMVRRVDLGEYPYCLIRECSRRLIVVAMRNHSHLGL